MSTGGGHFVCDDRGSCNGIELQGTFLLGRWGRKGGSDAKGTVPLLVVAVSFFFLLLASLFVGLMQERSADQKDKKAYPTRNAQDKTLVLLEEAFLSWLLFFSDRRAIPMGSSNL